VKFKGPLRVQGTVRIELASKPCEDPSKGRRVDVRLDRWEFNVAGLPRLVIPVGSFGPEGWLETTVCDEDLRISRGHKGSVFVLGRPGEFPPVSE